MGGGLLGHLQGAFREIPKNQDPMHVAPSSQTTLKNPQRLITKPSAAKVMSLHISLNTKPICVGCLLFKTQRVLSTHMGYTYPNHKGNYYYRNHTLYHIGTLDPLGERGPVIHI